VKSAEDDVLVKGMEKSPIKQALISTNRELNKTGRLMYNLPVIFIRPFDVSDRSALRLKSCQGW
jgi:hypothetical protein